MTNYILDRAELKEILLTHKTFIAKKVVDLRSDGVDVTKLTYRETDKFTDEFIDTMINTLPVENSLDGIDEVLKRVCGYASKDVLKSMEDSSRQEI